MLSWFLILVWKSEYLQTYVDFWLTLKTIYSAVSNKTALTKWIALIPTAPESSNISTLYFPAVWNLVYYGWILLQQTSESWSDETLPDELSPTAVKSQLVFFFVCLFLLKLRSHHNVHRTLAGTLSAV